MALRTALDKARVQPPGASDRLVGEPTSAWGATMTRGEARELIRGEPDSPTTSAYARRDDAVWYFVFEGIVLQVRYYDVPRPLGSPLAYDRRGAGLVALVLDAFTGSRGMTGGRLGEHDFGQSQLPRIEIPADIYDTEPAPPAPAAPVATAAPPATPAPPAPPLVVETGGWTLHEFGALIGRPMTVRLPPGWTITEPKWGVDSWTGAFVGPEFLLHLADLGYRSDPDIFRIAGGGPLEVDPKLVAQHEISVEPLDGGTVTTIQPREGVVGITGALFRVPDVLSMTVKARGVSREQQAIMLAIIRTIRPGGG